jgi:hypothetical protein
MKRTSVYFITGSMILFYAGCIRNVNVPIRTVPPVLVVEGSVTTDPPPYSINLSYSGMFTNTYQAGMDSNHYFVTDAKVTISDDLGDSTSCILSVNGTYQSVDSGFVGSVGRTYTLKVYLSNGKTFFSKPEKLAAVPPIDSLSILYDSSYITGVRPTQFIITVNAKDPPGISNYYRWGALGYVPRKSVGGPCCVYCSPPPCNLFNCTCNGLCEQLIDNSGQVNILSDQFIDGREIRIPVFYSPVYWTGIHYIQIKQYSISQDSYLFWQQYLAQTDRTGSILDPLPGPLNGNIFNQADSNELALGYFSASAVVTQKLIIVPYFLSEETLESVVYFYIEPGDCHADYPNSLEDDAVPEGWDSAQVVDLR